MNEEIWRDVKGYEGYYLVSNFGTVKSLDRYCKNRTGSGKQTGRILKQQKCKKGYLRVSISLDKRKFQVSSHRLVAIAFLDNPENKEQVNHINGIKDDNRLENLEWCTNTENIKHAYDNNLIKLNYGEKHHMAKLKNSDIECIINRINNGEFQTKIAKEFNMSATAISNIYRRKTYVNIK